ncbi:hypothetical protein ABB37_00558 [Leptomonas pyrrhocoris]|uniref:Uncharacterized protein n=1 Tax=Leptomonas pyrrhocoris TaxID=157538 RepID=A0A0M9GB00_LEPPY|nr:hypothetical protein ABB37_00558 [Leptomonas pyrrhocoris]KPA86366.1 hypothetical protein ABB37_00558 [Leptomonas pyrrhocoris]|eukprot:XP_015664805.1 hypothetical protein ABB37_00558 [Leptomonas pyrrhocoris]
MSSSDDDWKPQMRPAGLNAGTGQSAMMDARRRALQQQREAQQRQQPSQPRPATAGRREFASPTTVVPAIRESELPNFLTGFDDGGAETGASAPVRSPTQLTRIFPAAPAPSSSASAALSAPLPPTHEATAEELQRQIAAKKKLLQSTREREAALVEKWRVTKALKQAEVEQLNGKIRRVWAAIEDEKSAAETTIREAQDQHETELRDARRRVEQEVKAEYDAKMAEAQKQLSSAKAEEERLRQLLGDKGDSAATKDAVNIALTAAITAVMHKLDDVFQSEAEDGLRMEVWKSELQASVQREIHTSFAVGVESETQAERDEYERFFGEMLAFWRSAEDQERERLLKMDESLLTDLQSMAQQDLRRLQDEELGMERVYVESREAWAMEHQKLLQRELDGALQRRETELQEQRKQRHDLHVERLRDADARHQDVMAQEEALHQQKMEQLRAFFSREENLRAEQQRIESAAQESVVQSANVLRGVMASTEETVAAVKSYEQAVEEARRQVEVERAQYFKEQESLLENLQSLAATQCSNTDAERKALEDCAGQLRLTSQTMERHLQDEAAWLAQQEATDKHSRDEWGREYRRWQQLVEQERHAAEERFHEALTGLQQSTQLLEAEERDVAVERAALQRTFADLEAAAQHEVEALQRRAADVQSRSVAMADAQTRLSHQKDATAAAKKSLTQAQQRLEEERADLREDEARLRDMIEALRKARSRATLHQQRTELLQSGEAQQQQLLQQRMRQLNQRTVTAQYEQEEGNFTEADGLSRGVRDMVGDGGRFGSKGAQPPPPPPPLSSSSQNAGAGRSANTADAAGSAATVMKKRRHRSDPNRLPNKLFRELNDQLNHLVSGGGGGGNDGGGEAFVPTMRWTDPAYPSIALHPHHQRDQAASQRKSHRLRNVPSPANDLPPPLSASPQSARRERRVRPQLTPSPTPQQQQQQRQQRAEEPARHVDPSSLPLTSESSPSFSLHGDNDWSPSANTFTNLVDFSDVDTTTQSMR